MTLRILTSFRHKTQERYLLIRPDITVWSVRESVERWGAEMGSGCAPSMCPADPRAGISERLHQTSWKYKDGTEWRHGDIKLKC